MKTILLTGFEPFGGSQTNASEDVVRLLDGEVIDGWTIHGRILPCVFRRTQSALDRALVEVQPDLIVCLGEAGGRTAVTPELVAVNHTDARIPDNDCHQPMDTTVVRGGPVAYLSSLPVRAIVQGLAGAKIPAGLSRTAGGFVCNHLFYQLMHRLARSPKKCPGGFIHLPVTGAGWTPERLAKAVRLALRVSVRAAGVKGRKSVARRRSSRSQPRPGRSNKTSRD